MLRSLWLLSVLLITGVAHGQTSASQPPDHVPSLSSRQNNVSLRVESLGPPLTIKLGAIVAGLVMETRTVCRTPCIVRVPATLILFEASAPNIETTRETIDVPLEGLDLQVRAPTLAQRLPGKALIGVGSALLGVGAITLMVGGGVYGASAIEIQQIRNFSSLYPPSAPQTVAEINRLTNQQAAGTYAMISGGVIMAAGLAGLIPGIVLLKRYPAGIASSEPSSNPGPTTPPTPLDQQRQPPPELQARRGSVPSTVLTANFHPMGISFTLVR